MSEQKIVVCVCSVCTEVFFEEESQRDAARKLCGCGNSRITPCRKCITKNISKYQVVTSTCHACKQKGMHFSADDPIGF